MPPVDNPELALLLPVCPTPRRKGAATCTRCSWASSSTRGWPATSTERTAAPDVTAARGPAGHDWNTRTKTITDLQPDITSWFDHEVWTAALHDSGFSVTRR
jgi:hypothetical protein